MIAVSEISNGTSYNPANGYNTTDSAPIHTRTFLVELDPETLADRRAKMEAACREVRRDPATLGITALIGLWYPDLQANKPKFFDNPLTGTVKEIAAAIRGYAEIGVQHIMFQVEPYTAEARRRLNEAVQLYRGMDQQ